MCISTCPAVKSRALLHCSTHLVEVSSTCTSTASKMIKYAAALGALAVSSAAGIELDVSLSGGNASSPYLYGLMFEDISHSGDGTLYGQLLKNNGFQGGNPGLDAWKAVGSGNIAQDNATTIGKANHPSIRVSSSGNGSFGLSNSGYNGIRGMVHGEHDG